MNHHFPYQIPQQQALELRAVAWFEASSFAFATAFPTGQAVCKCSSLESRGSDPGAGN